MPPVYNGNMTAGQTGGYTSLLSDPRAGMLGDLSDNTIASAYADVAVPFGVGVVYTAEGKVALPSGSSDVVAGVVVSTMTRESIRDSLAPHYVAGDEMPVLRKGRVWIYTETALAVTATVYLRYTANGDLTPGDFRNDADTDKAVAVTSAKVVVPTTAAGYAMIELNLPQ